MNVETFHQRIKELYLPPQHHFTIVDVPEISFISIEGQGNPANGTFKRAVKWLFSIAHLIKPIAKERMGKSFVEPPLECLFWADDEADFVLGNRDKWKWRVMIVAISEWLSHDAFEEAAYTVETKIGPTPGTLRFEDLHEGQCVQVMHVGDYKGVSSICHELYNEFLPDNNLYPNGYYHEIYLNDPDRTAPEKRRVVVRQPVMARQPC